jgi:hypothetical protein
MRKFAFMKRIFAILFFVSILAFAANAQSTPKFSAYAATVEKARAKSIDFKRNPDARTFRTRLSEALHGGVNFAGHYVVAGWGCGTGCISGAIIDARTGNVYWPEQFNAMAAWYGESEYVDKPVNYRKNSRLLIITGVPGQKEDNAPEKPSGIYSYEWKNNRLRQVKFVPKPMGQ